MTNTTNYHWPKPADGDSQQTGKPWGDSIRTFMDAVDLLAHNQGISIDTNSNDITDLNASLSDIVSDSKLTMSEKVIVRSWWVSATLEKNDIDSKADTIGVSKTAYDNAYNALNSQNSIWMSSGTTDISAMNPSLYSLWSTYWAERTKLQNAFASTINTNLTNAQTQLTNILADGKLTDNEKLTLRIWWNAAQSKKADFDSLGDSLGIDTGNYDYAYSVLDSVSSTWTSSGTVDISLLNPTLYTRWTNYWTEEAKLSNAIVAFAQNVADNAQSTAQSANDAIANISSDNILSSGEKSAIILDYSNIINEQSGINAQADIYSITTEKTAYNNAITALTTYLGTLTTPKNWNDVSGNTTIDGSTFRTKFSTVYSTKQALLNAILAKAKTFSDDAKTIATATGNPDQLTGNDKKSIKSRRDSIVNEQTKATTGLDAVADAYTVPRTTYDSTITALDTYLATLTSTGGWNNSTKDWNDYTTIYNLGSGGGDILALKFFNIDSAKVDLTKAIADAQKSAATLAAQNTSLQKAAFLDANNKIIGSNIGAGTIAQSQLVSGLQVPVIVSSLPALPNSSYPSGSLVSNTSDGKLYRNVSGIWTSAVATVDLTGLVVDSQLDAVSASKVSGALTNATIATNKLSGTIQASQIADSAITTAKFASGIAPVEILNALPNSGNFQGRSVLLTTDNKLYRYTGSAWTSSVATSDLSGTIPTSSITGTFADSMVPGVTATATAALNAAPTTIVNHTAITLPNSSYPAGKIVYQTIDNTMWQVNTAGTGWQTPSIQSSLIIGTLTAGQISAGAIGTTQLAAGAVTANEIASGAITTNKIAAGAVTASTIAAGTITATQIATDTITAGQIAAGAISTSELAAGAITASKIAAGTITANEIATNTITATNIAGNTITASQIASGTITASEIASGTITANNIASGAITTAKLAAGAVTANEITAGTITGSKIAANTISASNLVANTITAGQIAAGAIGATQIAAGAISADKLNVTIGGSNLSYNSTFNTFNSVNDPALYSLYNNSPSETTTITQISSGGVDNGAFLRLTWGVANTSTKGILSNTGLTSTLVAGTGGVKGGWQINQTYIVAFWAKATGSNIGKTMNLAWNTQPSSQTAIVNPTLANVWQLYVFKITWGSSVEASGGYFITIASTGSSGTLDFDHLAIMQGDTYGGWKPCDDEIRPGSITAKEIAASSITGNLIAANTITASNIAANTITTSTLAFTPVQTNNVVGSINASSEGIRIAGNRITIDGTVNFNSGYDPSSKIAAGGAAADVNNGSTTISGGKITTGTLDASKIIAGTITASQIATGTITATQIAGQTITATQIAGGTITAAQIASGTITTSQLNFTPVTGALKDQVVTAINASTEGITISGGKITINGSTTFAANYDPSAALTAANNANTNANGRIATGNAASDVNNNVTTINGGKITANTITASQITTDLSTSNIIRSSNYSGGTSYSAPTGFKLSGTPYATRFIGDSSDTNVQMELGGAANFGGYQVGRVVGKAFTPVVVTGNIMDGLYITPQYATRIMIVINGYYAAGNPYLSGYGTCTVYSNGSQVGYSVGPIVAGNGGFTLTLFISVSIGSSYHITAGISGIVAYADTYAEITSATGTIYATEF